MIPIYQPYINDNNLQYAKDALDSGWISSTGKYLELAKIKLKELGYDWIVLTNNGTTATHLLAIALKKFHPKVKKVIVPNNVYVACWNSFLIEGYQLIPIDANIETWNISLKELGEKIDEETAILIVHNIGNVVNVPKIKKQFPNTIILEDNCEGFLGKYENKISGTECFASSISFFGNKTLTSGEGGAFITQDEEVFNYINKVKSQGQTNIKYLHDVIGYNYRMTNIQAAILYGQLLDKDLIINEKKRVFNLYKNNLSEIEEVSFQKSETNTEHSNWMFGIRLKDLSKDNKNKLEYYLYQSGIETRPMFYDIKKHEHLKNIICENKNAELLQNQIIILPSSPSLSNNQIDFITKKIKSFINDSNNNKLL